VRFLTRYATLGNAQRRRHRNKRLILLSRFSSGRGGLKANLNRAQLLKKVDVFLCGGLAEPCAFAALSAHNLYA
jgi:hypothetical protein